MWILEKASRIAVIAVLTVMGALAGAVLFAEATAGLLPTKLAYSMESLARHDKIAVMGFVGLAVGGLAGPAIGVALKRRALNAVDRLPRTQDTVADVDEPKPIRSRWSPDGLAFLLTSAVAGALSISVAVGGHSSVVLLIASMIAAMLFARLHFLRWKRGQVQ